MGNPAVKFYGSQPARYQIRIKGKIRGDWSDWLSGIELFTDRDGEGSQVTTLIGTIADQAALRGILCKIWDLNLTVLSVIHLELDPEQKKGE